MVSVFTTKANLEDIFQNSKNNMISGEDAFKLYDTYGYPIELTEECASERGFIVDNEGFRNHMELQKEQARRSRKVESSMNVQNELLLNYTTKSNFIGYDNNIHLMFVKNNKYFICCICSIFFCISTFPKYSTCFFSFIITKCIRSKTSHF